MKTPTTFVIWLGLLVGNGTAGLIADWTASSLADELAEGAPVPQWSETVSNRTVGQGIASQQPRLLKTATPNGSAAVDFDGNDILTGTGPSNPIGGHSAFSIAICFAVQSARSDPSYSQWWANSGLIDAEQFGNLPDWGVSVSASGQLGFGCGYSPDATVVTAGSLFDAQWHVVVVTRSATGVLTLHLDDNPPVTLTATSTGARTVGALMAIGGISSNAPFNPQVRRIVGQIAEIRCYDEALSRAESQALIRSLHEDHIGPVEVHALNFRLVHVENPTRDLLIRFDSEEGLGYRIEWSQDLLGWTTLTSLEGTGATLEYRFLGGGNLKRLFIQLVADGPG